MLRRGLRGSGAYSEAGRRLCSNAAGVPTDGDGKPEPIKVVQQARLWAMERVSKGRAQLANALKAWRFPACLDPAIDWLPEGVGRLLYLDKLQVHQHYWNLGEPGFNCTPFRLDIYGRDWERYFEKARIVASLEVYPQVINKNVDDEIINLTLVSPKHWGKRCRLHYFGEQDFIGQKKGGTLKKWLTYVALDCDLDVPLSNINVDVSNLDIGEEIFIKDLNLEVDLMPNLKPETPVCRVLPERN